MDRRPMTQDELFASVGLPELKPPPRAQPNPEIIISVPGHAGPEPPRFDLTPIEVEKRIVGWRMTADRLQQGICVEEIVGPAEASREVPTDIEPLLPEDEPVFPRPFAGDPEVRPSLRRRSGRRVRPEYIFGTDNRETYYPLGFPWKCVGRLDVWPLPSALPNYRLSGTASLIGKRTIVTAAHMYPWGSEKIFGEKPMIKFTAALYNGASIYQKASFVNLVYGNADHEQGDDLTVMRLIEPLGTNFGSFGVKTYNDAWEGMPYWTRCGYAGMFSSGNRPNRQQWFAIQDDDSDGDGWELEYEADATDGDSGGPVFGWWDGKPYIIGIHSGGEEEAFDTNNVAAGGPFLSLMAIWAWANWE